ncbi:MAG: hypothetical protein HUJ26_01135, partial [Planctomycetaceae bacterium]|nr:hypothetical protein [Planctomycetaceae bacterium]
MVKSFVSCLLLVFSVSLCQAQETTDSGKTIFEALDKNNDGFLTRDELGPEKEDLFNRLLTIGDRDEDGTLTREEFLKGASPQPAANPTPPTVQGRPGNRGHFPDPQQMFEFLDRNRDGQLTRAEMPEPFRERFAPVFVSVGKDWLNVEEFQTALSILREDAPSQQRQMPTEDQFFSRLDENQDGKVTIEEVPVTIRAEVKPLFDQLGKTAITREDFEKLRDSRDRGPIERTAADDRPAMQRPNGEFVPRGP